MTPEVFGEADMAVLNELVAGALYDIINAVFTKCPDWHLAKQEVMMEMIVEAIALRWGILDHAKLLEEVWVDVTGDRELLEEL